MIVCRGVTGQRGKSIRLVVANWYPSYQSVGGVPSTRQSFISWSASELPGASGRNRYISARMSPIAKISIGEL